ncbi:hypothetical protein AX15_006810 [Amanita polypyramis BW_CC]|nr:hypothetical protein AX15_006810 [Amanita polypyramis BW_CC]
MMRHVLGYSESTRARCHGPPPCNGSQIAVGVLRYGRIIQSEFGEKVEWSHWGCISTGILRELAAADLEQVGGFHELRNSDKQRIRLAIARRRIDPSDIPDTARSQSAEAPTSSSSASNPLKRRIVEHSVSHSQLQELSSSQLGLSQPGGSQGEEAEEDDPPDEEVKDELYCIFPTRVVGIQYYTGMACPGEEVLLVREPHNRYDRNAIQVKNINQIQVGHLPRQVVAKLAPLLDRRVITVEGVINDGNLSGAGYSLSITLKIYGPAGKRGQLEPQLLWATPNQRGFPKRSNPHRTTVPPSQRSQVPQGSSQDTQKAAELEQILNNLEKVDDEGRRGSLLDSLCSTEDVLNLPLHPNPPSIESGELLTNLLKHQSQALQWCMEREYPVLPKTEKDSPVQFWQLRKHGNKIYYFNIATKTPQEAPPLLGRGALCADAMGLGKTLTMLALTLATKGDIPSDYSKTTLIVCPLSILSNWEQQVQDHCVPDVIKYIVYHGTNRSLGPQELTKYDIVITTYQTVSGEYTNDSTNGLSGPSKKRRKSGKTLFSIPWKRIILDEGHTIRNPKTKMAKAIFAINAQRRWVLSGTPIVNSPNDLGSLLTFLQICQPLDNEDFYKRLLLRPLRYGHAEGAELLRALMNQICIRRTKEMHDSEGNALITLPPVEIIRVPVRLNDEARQLYNQVESIARQRLEKILTEGMNTTMQANALSMLTRLRQLALHPGLIPQNYIEELKGGDSQTSSALRRTITPEEKFRLRTTLAQAIEDCEECPVCYSILNEPRITSCAHIYCLACIKEVISRDQKCPMDRHPLGMDDLHEPPPPTELTQPFPTASNDNGGIRSESSAKVEQLIHLLKLLPSTEKCLVFSQFTSFMDKIAGTFEEEGISYVRFDGQMSAKRRQEAIARFTTTVESLRCGQKAETHTSAKRSLRPKKQSTIRNRALIDDDESVTESDSDFTSANVNDQTEDESDALSLTGKGKGKTRVCNANDTLTDNPRVMLISLKAGALGLNLTAANNVFLMDPWWQEGIESQAIDRVNRIGQQKPVHVYQLIAENTVESKVLEIQDRKKNLVKQAFSGMRSAEKQRQQREARLQDLIELFGMRREVEG